MNTPSQEYIQFICSIYDDIYDDRIEDFRPPAAGDQSCIPGDDWRPGRQAEHKSLAVFQRELEERGIHLSTSKIKKILVTGGVWTTERSRMIQDMFSRYTADGMERDKAVKRIAKELKISRVSVSVNLPYSSVVYNLENRSDNAKRCARYKERLFERRKAQEECTFAETLRNLDDKVAEELLWDRIASLQGTVFRTSGRNGVGGVEFTYTVKKGNDGSWTGEMFVSTKEKSITRATVMKAYHKAAELEGMVAGPKKLGTFGASYLYSIFKKLGVIRECAGK